MKNIVLAVILLMSIAAYGQGESVASSSGKRWGAFGTFAYADTWLPGKLGATVSYGDDSRVWELAYQSASYSFDVIIDDLGEISDTRIHLSTRSFTWDTTFNFQYGIYYNSLNVSLGNSYTKYAGVDSESVEINTAGVLWGVGNRWHWENWAVGADWFKVFWPLAIVNTDTKFLSETSKDSDEEDIRELVDGITSIPTFTLVHFEVGYRF